MTSITPPGGGPTDTPYDQTGISALAGGMPQLPTPQAGVAQNAQPPVDQAPQGLVSQLGAGNTDQLTGDQLGQLDQNPEDALVAEMEQILNNPQTPPAQRAAIEQQLALAARKQMLGGASQLGGQS